MQLLPWAWQWLGCGLQHSALKILISPKTPLQGSAELWDTVALSEVGNGWDVRPVPWRQHLSGWEVAHSPQTEGLSIQAAPGPENGILLQLCSSPAPSQSLKPLLCVTGYEEMGCQGVWAVTLSHGCVTP